jgi:hypothetical protein
VTLPFTDGNAANQAVLLPDKAAGAPVLERMRRFDTEPVVAAAKPSDVRVKVLNGSGRSGVAQTVTAGLSDAGFTTTGSGNDERGRVSVTEVRFANGADAKALLLLSYVGTTAKLVNDPTLKDADVVVVLGVDFGGLTKPGAPAPGPDSTPNAAPADEPAALGAACR